MFEDKSDCLITAGYFYEVFLFCTGREGGGFTVKLELPTITTQGL